METSVISKTILFIHGLFMNPKNWENWEEVAAYASGWLDGLK